MMFDRESSTPYNDEYDDILYDELILLSRNLSRSSHIIYMGILCLQPYSLCVIFSLVLSLAYTESCSLESDERISSRIAASNTALRTNACPH